MYMCMYVCDNYDQNVLISPYYMWGDIITQEEEPGYRASILPWSRHKILHVNHILEKYHNIQQNFHWLKITPMAHTTYSDKNFTEFNFANLVGGSIHT